MVITISRSGEVKALYRDELRNLFESIGTLSVERASDVEFDSGLWYVKKNNTNLIPTGFIRRSDAIRAEIEHLEKTL